MPSFVDSKIELQYLRSPNTTSYTSVVSVVILLIGVEMSPIGCFTIEVIDNDNDHGCGNVASLLRKMMLSMGPDQRTQKTAIIGHCYSQKKSSMKLAL